MNSISNTMDRIIMFGAFEVVCRGQVITPTAPKQTQLLALLLLSPGQAISRELITEELWGSRPPPTYKAAIHTYVMQLRRALRGFDGELIVASQKDSRYGVVTENIYSDLASYLALRDVARRYEEDRDRKGFIATAKSAVDQWKSNVLADVPHGAIIDDELHNLRMRHDRLRQDLATALICDEAFSEGLALLADSQGDTTCDDLLPLRFYCLARQGRRAEALRLYSGVQSRLSGTNSLRWLRDVHADLVGRDGKLKPYNHYVPAAS